MKLVTSLACFAALALHSAAWAQPAPGATTQQQIGIRPLPPSGPERAPAHECDQLAQPPKAIMGSLPTFADGVAFSALRWPAARAACARAMQEYPSEVRFRTFAARAADKSGDARAAVRLYEAAAGEGDPVAQYNLAVMHGDGQGGLARNNQEAVRLYKLAADQGYLPAFAALGTAHATGRGVRRDDAEAVRLFKLGVEQGDPEAYNNLGKMYAEGRGGLPRDMRQATAMWRAAADQGIQEAASNLRKAGVR